MLSSLFGERMLSSVLGDRMLRPSDAQVRCFDAGEMPSHEHGNGHYDVIKSHNTCDSAWLLGCHEEGNRGEKDILNSTALRPLTLNGSALVFSTWSVKKNSWTCQEPRAHVVPCGAGRSGAVAPYRLHLSIADGTCRRRRRDRADIVRCGTLWCDAVW